MIDHIAWQVTQVRVLLRPSHFSIAKRQSMLSLQKVANLSLRWLDKPNHLVILSSCHPFLLSSSDIVGLIVLLRLPAPAPPIVPPPSRPPIHRSATADPPRTSRN